VPVGSGLKNVVVNKAGFARAGTFSGGPCASVFQEAGRALVGGNGFGASQKSGAEITSTKFGFAVSGLNGFGSSASVFVEAGFGKIGANGYGPKLVVGQAIIRPSADQTLGGWHDTPLYPSIDESVPDDGDFIESGLNPVTADICELKLQPATDPGIDTDHLVRFRVGRNVDGLPLSLTVRLVQGTTVIESWTVTPTSTPTTYTQTVSSVNAATITNYSDLRLRFEAVLI
jgi:hypothetical protein